MTPFRSPGLERTWPPSSSWTTKLNNCQHIRL